MATDGPDAWMSVGGVVTHVTGQSRGCDRHCVDHPHLVLATADRSKAHRSSVARRHHERLAAGRTRVVRAVYVPSCFPCLELSSLELGSAKWWTITHLGRTHACVARREPEQSRPFASSQKVPRLAYSRKHAARERSLRSELLVSSVLYEEYHPCCS